MKQKNNFQFLETSRLDAEKIASSNRTTKFTEIYKPTNQAQIQTQAERCMSCGTPFCQWKCPVHNYIPDWLQLANEDKLEEAVELCHETNSLPEICGRVCPQDRLCEGACTLNDGIGAVTIGAVEKNITDKMLAKNWRPDLSDIKKTNKKVAIVGAGPAGLACADVLIRNGVTPEVFDAYPEIGGLLTFGIPEFKLEKSVMQTRRQFFVDLGVKFHCNTKVGTDVEFASLLADYDAVFLAIGTYKQVSANLENNQKATKALDFLIANVNNNLNLNNTDYPFNSVKNKNVVVLGGGDTAMDCTRTAIRQGAKNVTCVYRRDESDMPGSKKEIINAQEEGVKFIFNRQPLAILTTADKVTGVKTLTTKSDEVATDNENTFNDWDKVVQLTIGCETPNSHKKLYQVPDSEQTIDADVVITAFGFRAEKHSWLEKAGIKTDDYGRIITSTEKNNFGQTGLKNVFAGGDVVLGSDLVVTAIDEGRKSAHSLLNYLKK